MKNRAVALVLASIIGLALYWRPVTRPSSTTCDTLAADPDDKNRAAAGVPDGNLVPRLVIPACEAAVREDGANLSYKVQLGRGYEAAERYEEAVAQWEAARLAGSSAASFYLARMRIRRYWEIADTDETQARAILDEVADSLQTVNDYAPAEALLRRLMVRPEDFRMRRLVELILQGDWARINRARLIAVGWWVSGVQEAMSLPFHPDCQAFPATLVQPVVTRALDRADIGDPSSLAEALLYRGGKVFGGGALFLTDFVWSGDLAHWRKWVKDIGIADGLSLSRIYCDTPAAFEFYRQLIHLANEPLRLSEYADDLRTLRSIKDVLPELMPYFDKAPIGATLEKRIGS